jgi:hypothetical protein
MGIDTESVHPCLLTIVDALAELGGLVLEKSGSDASPGGEAVGKSKDAGVSTTTANDVDGEVIP